MCSTASQTIPLSFPPIMPALLVKLSHCAQYDLQPHVHTHRHAMLNIHALQVNHGWTQWFGVLAEDSE